MGMFVETTFATTLGLSALLAFLVAAPARGNAFSYTRFSAALFGALAIADVAASLTGTSAMSALADTMAPMVSALAAAALALALHAAFEFPPRPAIAACVLVLAALAGIVSAATGAFLVSFAVLFAAICAMLVSSVRHWQKERSATLQAIAGAGALLAGSAAFMSGGGQGRIALALFSSAGLLGLSLALAKPSHALVERKAARGTPSGLHVRSAG